MITICVYFTPIQRKNEILQLSIFIYELLTILFMYKDTDLYGTIIDEVIHMIEVVFSDSTKGMMIQARKDHILDSEDILNIGFYFDIGDITKGIDSKERKLIFEQLFDIDNEDEKTAFFDAQRKDMNKLLNAASKGEQIRLWISKEPYTLCGYYFVCYILKDIKCSISVISLPDFIPGIGQSLIDYGTWDAVSADLITQFLPFEKPILGVEKKVYSERWQQLMSENTKLRAVVNGQLVSVPENFYDSFMQRYIPEGDFQMLEVIGNVCGLLQLGVLDGWYALRIEKMIEDKKLVIVRDNIENPYFRVLRKA